MFSQNPKYSRETIEEKAGKGWEYSMTLTASLCDVYIQRDNKGEIIPNKVLYCFYDGERKGVITEKPWKTFSDFNLDKEDHRGV